MEIKPSLFGQKHSSRDYSLRKNWGKNMFNSSFPASLVAYMSSKNVKPVYICIDDKCQIKHDYISGTKLFGIDPLSDKAFYTYEAEYPYYSSLYTGPREKMDLVMVDMETKEGFVGL